MSILETLQRSPRLACAGTAIVGPLSVALTAVLDRLSAGLLDPVFEAVTGFIYSATLGLYLFALKKAKFSQAILYATLGIPAGSIGWYVAFTALDKNWCGKSLACVASFGVTAWVAVLALATVLLFPEFRRPTFVLALVVAGAVSGYIGMAIGETLFDPFSTEALFVFWQSVVALIVGYGLLIVERSGR